MMDTKHTPGNWMAIEGDTLNERRPWGICVYLSREAHDEIDGDDAHYPSRTEVIAEVCDGPTAEADARLMAAAPDILAALEEVVQAMADYQMNVDEPPPHRHCQMMDAARAAIAAAKGEA